jgi:hypothetical protein
VRQNGIKTKFETKKWSMVKFGLAPWYFVLGFSKVSLVLHSFGKNKIEQN